MRKTSTINGLRFHLVRTGIKLTLLWIALKRFRNPAKVITMARQLRQQRDQIFGSFRPHKYAFIDGKYFISFAIPRWPSSSFNRYVDTHFRKIEQPAEPILNTLLFAVTKKCGFQCEHCFEWNNLNKKETLTRDDILSVINRFYDLGVTMVTLSGGEPMNRFSDIIHVLQQAPRDIEFWIYTNGYALTEEKAIMLKQAGLTGLAISLDHYDESEHDTFRGVNGSYKKLLESADICEKTGLAVAFSVCVTHSLAKKEELMKLAAIAHQHHVRFLQILEPKAVGHYAGKDVTLNENEIAEIENFFITINYDRQFAHYPIAIYHGFYNRRAGCLGAAKNFVYVDTDGNVHSCPFCQAPLYSALKNDLTTNVKIHKKQGCEAFSSTFVKLQMNATENTIS